MVAVVAAASAMKQPNLKGRNWPEGAGLAGGTARMAVVVGMQADRTALDLDEHILPVVA